MNNIKIEISVEVQAYGGGDIRRVIGEMIDLADRLRINVWASLNGVRVLARLGNEPEALFRAWAAEIDARWAYSIASTEAMRTYTEAPQ